MANKKKRKGSRKTVDKWKTKKWYKLLSPKIFGQKVIGETPALKPQNLEGRTIKTTLDVISGDRRLRHIEAKFKVDNIQGENAYTIVKGHEIKPGYLNRMVRRRKSKIDSVTDVVSSDGKKARIKATTICMNKTTRENERQIRKIMNAEIVLNAKNNVYDKFFEQMVFGTLSQEILKKAKEITGVKRIEITKSRIIEGK